jgi:spoIIIJ-associated protein
VYDAEVERRIVDFLGGVLARMGYPADVSASFEEGAYQLSVRTGSDDEGALIGRKGETLDALQHLAYKVSGRGRAEPSTIRIDVSGYREKREKELAEIALELAQEVKSTGTARQTEPLRAADRRIVHRAVTEVGGVTTRALGTGLIKKVLIELEGAAPMITDEPSVPSAAARATDGVLDFVSHAPSEPVADDAALMSDWGRKPRPVRPGRRR